MTAMVAGLFNIWSVPQAGRERAMATEPRPYLPLGECALAPLASPEEVQRASTVREGGPGGRGETERSTESVLARAKLLRQVEHLPRLPQGCVLQ